MRFIHKKLLLSAAIVGLINVTAGFFIPTSWEPHPSDLCRGLNIGAPPCDRSRAVGQSYGSVLYRQREDNYDATGTIYQFPGTEYTVGNGTNRFGRIEYGREIDIDNTAANFFIASGLAYTLLLAGRAVTKKLKH